MSATSADHHIAFDGTLKQDTITVNDLSAYSYKARVRGCNDVSVLYAYDIEVMEPICAEVFQGNSIDAVHILRLYVTTISEKVSLSQIRASLQAG